ncbi:unnamed protein product [Thelazia callipaeda]|uniref:Acetyltransf_18 domain-containing protein n=1 Tax=Thelazia callipaeda TaxID=103827 RepID=A0A0N5D0P2_THECL|nr:unnamed protein product [Thelazia callipaeda]
MRIKAKGDNYDDGRNDSFTGALNAMVSMIKYSASQAYCMAVKIDQSISDKYINIEPTNNSSCYQIVDVQDVAEDMSLQPLFIQVHHNPKNRLPLQHLIDEAAGRTLGNVNLELTKNITVDLTDDDDIDLWRDKAGFVVRDNLYLCELTVNKSQFEKTLRIDTTVNISEFHDSQMQEILKFDKTLCFIDRSKYLQYLFKCTKVIVAENNDKLIMGYGIFEKDRILALYANDSGTAHAIVQKMLQLMDYTEVTFCTKKGCWSIEDQPETGLEKIKRLHTRTTSVNIVWEKIFALNVGVNLI